MVGESGWAGQSNRSLEWNNYSGIKKRYLEVKIGYQTSQNKTLQKFFLSGLPSALTESVFTPLPVAYPVCGTYKTYDLYLRRQPAPTTEQALSKHLS